MTEEDTKRLEVRIQYIDQVEERQWAQNPKHLWRTVSPQLILGCGWYAPLLTRSVNTQLALCRVL
jgi:hypothetical protein